MRLWHYKLIPHLSKQWLQGQHRECAALRGKGWGKRHNIIDYVFTHDYSVLFYYHQKVMSELITQHGVKISPEWLERDYRGKILGTDETEFTDLKPVYDYPEHNKSYLAECLENLREKGENLCLNAATGSIINR